MSDKAIAEAANAKKIVDKYAVKIAKGEMTVETLLAAVREDLEPQAVEPKPPVVPPITEEHRAAIARLPKVYGRVALTTRRALSDHELELLTEERQTIATVLDLLQKRKDTSLRETISTHFDVLAEQAGTLADKDSRGHYVEHQEQEVPKFGKKFVRQVSEPKPTVDASKLLDLYEAGKLTRNEYLSLTSEPKVKRTFDPEKAVKAISKNPSLLFVLAEATTQNPANTSIYLR